MGPFTTCFDPPTGEILKKVHWRPPSEPVDTSIFSLKKAPLLLESFLPAPIAKNST
jgi:hypothetical protein